ncbi:hypothetical protein KO527_16555 [Pseudoalteromonas sp. C2R02]|uniref:hypothetical protein n=1 Tax=Pseudoalteromonas sp. C2R02 TaxID=2841565 RepID=UPI001C08BD99|nr:hypothetical protein [Pseudoalteromonas sp. C2R02]MBU2970965.1 hypothetical protein [Pseudoalteromonas sp. C2R02]
MYQKTRLQKVSYVFSILFFIGAACSTVWLLFKGESVSIVFKSNVAATAFFCFTSAIVLLTMATTNLPNLKIDKNIKQ